MPLANDSFKLRDRILADLDADHDYYVHTRSVWRLSQRQTKSARQMSIRNPITGNVISRSELSEKANFYVRVRLAESTFQTFIATFESFLFDLVRLWLSAHPRSLGEKLMPVKDLLDAPDKDFALQSVVDREIVEISYKRPADWFDYLDRRIKLGCPTADEIERFSEAKAARDVLVHSRGLVGKTYLFKAGRLARFREGERIDITDQYHRETWELIRKLAEEISNAAVAKMA